MSRFVAQFWTLLFATGVCAASLFAQAAPSAKPIAVKVVVVTMFERGEDTGDAPGEYQLWVEREHLDRVIPVPAGYHHVRMNGDGVLGMLTGVGTARAAASVMAFGLDPRFDFSKAYWIVAGIGGGDPADVSLGSAVWADRVLDSDLAYEIDAREIPKDWPTGYVPLNRATPYEQPARSGADGEMYALNPQLVALGVSADERHAARRFRYHARIARALHRIPQRDEAAVRCARRRDVRQHFLARRADGRMGERLGLLFHRRQRKFHGLGAWRIPARCKLSRF